MNLNELRKLPKVELHRHLEGSVRFDTIRELARRHQLDLGVESDDELGRKTQITTPMNSLEEVLDVFRTTQKVLCSYEALKRVTFENVEDAFNDGVKLLELRFAPVFIAHRKEIAFDEIMEGILDGMSIGMEKYPIQVGLIHILPRGLDMDKHPSSTKEFLRYRKSRHQNAYRLCGFDLADSETETPPSEYIPFINMAREAGAGITIHSGENTNALSVRETIHSYEPSRIGHGIKSNEDPDVVELLKEKDIHLEVCPTSNWLTRSVESIETHPLPQLYRAGVSLSINSDDPHLMAIDLVNEYQIAHRVFGLTGDELYGINKQALHRSFLDPEAKKKIAGAYFND
ncbi:MAG: adenosine deaminase [bacterium]|nr:adenosine deaminase [bacterium]